MLDELFKILNVLFLFILLNIPYPYIIKNYKNSYIDEFLICLFLLIIIELPGLFGLSSLIIYFMKIDDYSLYIFPICCIIAVMQHIFYKIKEKFPDFILFIKYTLNNIKINKIKKNETLKNNTDKISLK